VAAFFGEAQVGWEFTIILSGMVAEAAIILLMLRGRTYTAFPIFFFYLCWSLFSDALLYYVRVDHGEWFFNIYIFQLSVDSAMILAVLVELAWSVVRPIRKSLPKRSLTAIIALFALGALIIWPIAGLVAPDNLSRQWMMLFRLQQTPAILRAVFFLALAAFSQLLSISLRDRELQIATGLGFFSIVSLAVTILHTHKSFVGSASYLWLDRAVGISYLVALIYWAYCFARQPVERREFTPQMKSMLLAIAGAARTARIDLEESTKSTK
jgi:hypothetical protein